MSTVVDLQDAAAYYGRLVPQVRQAARRGLLSAAMRAVNIIVSQIIPSRVPAPVDRGVYRAGWKYREIKDGATYFNNEEQALYIEGGVRAENVKPGAAMIDALARWVVRKGLPTKYKERTTSVRGGFFKRRAVRVKGTVLDRARGVAWAIARTMQRKGIFNQDGRGLGIMAEMNERHLPGVVQQEVGAEIGKVFQ